MNTQQASPDLAQTVGHVFRPVASSYAEKEAAFYALAIGASADPLDTAELQFTYELNGAGFSTFPTFASTFPVAMIGQIGDIPDQRLNLLDILYGEHYLELPAPLPPSADILSQARISHVYDKGSGALLVIEIKSKDQAGKTIAINRASFFIRGRGGFGGERGPSSKTDSPPLRSADVLVSDATRANQALLFRLASGDLNPLHADARLAPMLGFERPILHGLCTYGFAARAVLETFAANDPTRLFSFKARFSHHIFPGETIQTEMWQESETDIFFQSRVVERDEIILSNGLAKLNPA
ncbi:MAG: MaoC/PaaZ C-terminal domain-containing protein [Candidatus Promineifilaceae bacterium]